MMQVHSRVGADGVLKLNLPLGKDEANAEVLITIQATGSRSEPMRQAPWTEFLDETYGSCGDLGVERVAQGDYETRETLD